MSDDKSSICIETRKSKNLRRSHWITDAEVLISAGEILCRETVHLLKVHIHIGKTEDLMERKKPFLPASRWINMFLHSTCFSHSHPLGGWNSVSS